MAILEKPKQNGIVIDLTGPQGNAFYLLGMAKKLANQLDFPQDFILNEMKSGDYEKLINVFDHYFGSVVTLYR
jgi:hypothetical protein